jgi:hypothetical protein
MKRTSASISLALGLALLAVGCGAGNDRTMMGASPGMGRPGAAFISVTPQGGATGVPGSAPIVFRFGAVMGAGMEQYIDLHEGDLAGTAVPMHCSWSGDRTTLTCTPQGPLASRRTYGVHLGGGLMTHAGQPLDCGQYGPTMGGQWIMGGMMGGSHAGGSWGMMGPRWHNANGSYGMVFSFQTA